MNVVFLDIDGVLNSDTYYARRGDRPVHLKDSDSWHIDPATVDRLNRVIVTTGARVVLSSDWRREPEKPGLAKTEAALHKRGATFRLYDATPVLSEDVRRERFGLAWQGNYTPRALEIQYWLDEHPRVSRYAIVDDEPDMQHLADRLVLTDASVGLTDQDCAELLKLLSGS